MSVVRRVEKLIALANGGSTEEEARTAAREAARLIGAHNLKLVEQQPASQGNSGFSTSQASWQAWRDAQERAQRQREAYERAAQEQRRREAQAKQAAQHHGGPADLKFYRVRSTRLLVCARCGKQIRVGDTIAWPGGFHAEHAQHERCFRGVYELHEEPS